MPQSEASDDSSLFLYLYKVQPIDDESKVFLGWGACYHFQTNLPSVCAIITPVWRQETLETEERRGEAAAGHH